MKFGIKNIYQDGRYGMPLLHMQAILQTAEAHNIVIGIRPISKYALSFIEDGCPTKPYAVKNKTANIGIAAGLIVINPDYCQVAEHEYEKYTEQLNEAFSKDADLKPIPCVLSEKHIITLTKAVSDNMLIQRIPTQDGYSISWQKNDKTIHVTAQKNAQRDDYTIFDVTGKPLQVLGKTIIDSQNIQFTKPITADYDLLVICPTHNDHNPSGKDKTPFSTQDPLHSLQSIIKASLSSNYIGPKEDDKGGNWSERTKEVVRIINENIAHIDIKRKGKNLETVHHNSEFHNPFAADLIRHLPCLIALPRKMNLSSLTDLAADATEKLTDKVKAILVDTQEELQTLYKLICQNKYYWPAHSKFPHLSTHQFEKYNYLGT